MGYNFHCGEFLIHHSEKPVFLLYSTVLKKLFSPPYTPRRGVEGVEYRLIPHPP